MCTVSAITLPAGGFRIACNRDELLTRPLALLPIMRAFGDRHAMLPIDPLSGGTWIAVNDAGLAMAILNVNSHRRLALSELRDRESRGQIIPSLLYASDVREAADLAAMIDPIQFAPFRLLLIDEYAWTELRSDGWETESTHGVFDGPPLMLTSSGLGDELVEHPRRELFDRMIRTADSFPRRQDAFHAHQWPDRAHLSVMMNRNDARTVSQTVIEVRSSAARMEYRADGALHGMRLELQDLVTT